MKGYDKTIPSHKPFILSCHTNHPSHKPSFHTNHLLFSVLYIIWFVWRYVIQRRINGLCEGLVCVDGLCEPTLCYALYYIPLLFSVLHPFTQTIPSYKPFIITLHTNQLICNTENDKWFVWRDGLCEGMVCVKGCFIIWFVWMVCVKGCNTENNM